MSTNGQHVAPTVLITGGAGFIGSHLADELLAHGYRVRVLDALSSQVHGEGNQWPDYLAPRVERIHGDVRDRETVGEALDGVDAVIHLAAAVGVGQSMYEVKGYTSTNNLGTAVLLEEVIERPVDRLVVASSMSIYGEGLYHTADGQTIEGHRRSHDQLEDDEWELNGPDGNPMTPLPTPEDKSPTLASVYALSKYDQERLCLMMGRAYDLDATALRLFNVYGPRQALSNPYTGVLAIFASRYLNDNPPLIFEDGLQKRDFVYVTDVARAFRLALETDEAAGKVFNVGSGQAFTILEVARRLGRVLGKEQIAPEITREYRMGDIRHCFADITRAQNVLGYTPQISFDDGLTTLAAWVEDQTADDDVETASAELAERGLTV